MLKLSPFISCICITLFIALGQLKRSLRGRLSGAISRMIQFHAFLEIFLIFFVLSTARYVYSYSNVLLLGSTPSFTNLEESVQGGEGGGTTKTISMRLCSPFLDTLTNFSDQTNLIFRTQLNYPFSKTTTIIQFVFFLKLLGKTYPLQTKMIKIYTHLVFRPKRFKHHTDTHYPPREVETQWLINPVNTAYAEKTR